MAQTSSQLYRRLARVIGRLRIAIDTTASKPSSTPRGREPMARALFDKIAAQNNEEVASEASKRAEQSIKVLETAAQRLCRDDSGHKILSSFIAYFDTSQIESTSRSMELELSNFALMVDMLTAYTATISAQKVNGRSPLEEIIEKADSDPLDACLKTPETGVTFFRPSSSNSKSIRKLLRQQGAAACRDEVEQKTLVEALHTFDFGFLRSSPTAQIGAARRSGDGQYLYSFLLGRYEESEGPRSVYIQLLCSRDTRTKWGPILLAAAEAHAIEFGAKRIRLSAIGETRLPRWYEEQGYNHENTILLTKGLPKVYEMAKKLK
ncbi:hypothetical protein HDV00_007878 [Rhizophlyctis rosea]|nr:hypothetical protein HDV00_007878 [Rhizophlyctis rosea]